jgi:hypothetical protein
MESTVSRLDALQVSASPAGPALTPSQKRFNTLLKKIEEARQTLAAWNEGTSAYRQAHGEVLKPLQEQLVAGHRQWVLALDAVLEQGHCSVRAVRTWNSKPCSTSTPRWTSTPSNARGCER